MERNTSFNKEKTKKTQEHGGRIAQTMQEINLAHSRTALKKGIRPTLHETKDLLFLLLYYAERVGDNARANMFGKKITSLESRYRRYSPFTSQNEHVRTVAGIISAIREVKKRFAISKN